MIYYRYYQFIFVWLAYAWKLITSYTLLYQGHIRVIDAKQILLR